MKKSVIIMLALPLLVFAQVNRDTSFTIRSAYEKVRKDYPFVKPAEIDSQGVKIFKDIVYYTDGERKLKLDLFMPESADAKLPLIVIVHGGGWRSGHKEMEHPIASRLSGKNYITATVEYRLSTEALYPAAILDVKRAICQLKKNPEIYKIDTTKIVVMGMSAGGQIAAMAELTDGVEKFSVDGCSINAAAIIDIDGVFDMTTPSESGKDTIPSKPSAAKQWLGFTYRDKPDLWVEASPLRYVDSTSPPMLFINSSLPRFHAGRDEAIDILNEHGIYSEVHTIENTPHPFWLFHPWQERVVDWIDGFLKKTLN
ncbi:alpha/beta hydrolase fold domain-containing protein [Melioribacter sp. Ez-97]|uniref:alpha/beta hydrolase fold domain-containing protein n=1 Tax=Melioribacter sp. Ez-97 TaxID=3423434 RepID=UPI003EDA2FB8